MQNQITIGSANPILLGNRVLLRLKQLHGIEQRVVHIVAVWTMSYAPR